jgi:hypothetical protein
VCGPAAPVQGSVLIRRRVRTVVKQRDDGTPVERERLQLCVLHSDLIGPQFWDAHADLLA